MAKVIDFQTASQKYTVKSKWRSSDPYKATKLLHLPLERATKPLSGFKRQMNEHLKTSQNRGLKTDLLVRHTSFHQILRLLAVKVLRDRLRHNEHLLDELQTVQVNKQHQSIWGVLR